MRGDQEAISVGQPLVVVCCGGLVVFFLFFVLVFFGYYLFCCSFFHACPHGSGWAKMTGVVSV